jgi:serpin B
MGQHRHPDVTTLISFGCTMLVLRRVSLLGVAFSLLACGNPSGPPGSPPLLTALPRSLTGSEQAMIAASNRFGGNLLAALSQAQPDSNIFISPLSASMALGMTMNGASGTTFDEMRATLGFPAQMTGAQINGSYRDLIALLRGFDPRVDFRIANAIWYRQAFGPAVSPTFLAESRDFFDARVAGLDFASPGAVTTVNAWASEATNGKITKVITELVMLLANAIYFKGDWREAFDPRETRPEAFTPRTGPAANVPMMHRTGNARAAEIDGRTFVDLGYGGDAFSMTIVLPRAGEDVNAMIGALGAGFWSAIPTLQTVEVDLAMPRFKLSWEKRLNAELSQLGMPTAFVPGGADFTRLSPSRGRDLFISFVQQNTFVDVNEVGTEAAAVTTVGIGIVSVPQRFVVRVDRPFVFVLRERLSGTVLFIGRMVRI